MEREKWSKEERMRRRQKRTMREGRYDRMRKANRSTGGKHWRPGQEGNRNGNH